MYTNNCAGGLLNLNCEASNQNMVGHLINTQKILEGGVSKLKHAYRHLLSRSFKYRIIEIC